MAGDRERPRPTNCAAGDLVQTPVHGCRARSDATERIMLPGQSPVTPASRLMPSHMPEQGQDRSDKRPTEDTRALYLASDLAPGVPQP